MAIFIIVGTHKPLYEVELKNQSEDSAHVTQFVVHSSLDMVEEVTWTTQSMYLKTVDKFNEQLVSAYITASNVKLMLLHETRNEDGIRNFFQEVHELYIKVLLNPFYEYNSPIRCPIFDARVRALSRRYL